MGISCLPVKGENFFNEWEKLREKKHKQKSKMIREVRKWLEKKLGAGKETQGLIKILGFKVLILKCNTYPENVLCHR